jgi:hypothetical protein
MRISRTVAVSALAGIVFLIPLGAAAGKPAAPVGMSALTGRTGGNIVLGEIRGAASTGAVLTTGMRRTHGYFTHATLGSIVRSPDDHLMLATFHGSIGRRAIRGLAIAAHAPSGASGFALLYDDANRFGATASPLMDQLQETIAQPPTSPTVPAIKTPPMHPFTARDGTFTAQIPTGWAIRGADLGSLITTGPKANEVVIISHMIKLVDPRSQAYQLEQRNNAHTRFLRPGQSLYGIPMEYTGSPVQAVVGALTASTLASGQPDPHVKVVHAKALPPPPGALREYVDAIDTERGHLTRSETMAIIVPPTQLGIWSINVIATSAVAADYQRELPTMVAVLKAYKVDNAAMTSVVHQNIAQIERLGANARRNEDAATQGILDNSNRQMAQNRATFNASMQNAANVQSGIDRSTAGFVHYLNGTDVVENRTTGVRTSTDAGIAQAAAANDPAHYRLVPVSQYQKGVDF